jgi:phenylacetic acid degradation operon negative regulatory protein
MRASVEGQPIRGSTEADSDVGMDASTPEPARRRRVAAAQSTARSFLLTILGELVVPAGEPVWTAALLYGLAGLGISEQTARQTIARAAEAGWLEGEKQGRTVRWSTTPVVVEVIDDIIRRLMSLNTAPRQWDGNCLILVVTISDEMRTARKRLYSALGWAGFGNPAPGLWASPHVDRLEEARAAIEELGLEDSTIAFIGRLAQVGLSDREIVARAWDLDEVAARYAALLARVADLRPEPGDDLLFTHLALVDEWRKFPAMDPQLPEDLLPDWIGRRAADAFVARRASWKPAARERWREIVKFTAPDG